MVQCTHTKPTPGTLKKRAQNWSTWKSGQSVPVALQSSPEPPAAHDSWQWVYSWYTLLSNRSCSPQKETQGAGKAACPLKWPISKVQNKQVLSGDKVQDNAWPSSRIYKNSSSLSQKVQRRRQVQKKYASMKWPWCHTKNTELLT